MSKKRSQNKSPNMDNPPSSSSASSHPSLSTKLSTTPVKKVKKVVPSSSSSASSYSSSIHPSLSTKLSTTPINTTSSSKPSNNINNISNSSDSSESFSLESPTSTTFLIYPNVSNYSTIASSPSNIHNNYINDESDNDDFNDESDNGDDYNSDSGSDDQMLDNDKNDSRYILNDTILSQYRPYGWCKNPPKPSSLAAKGKDNQRRIAKAYTPYIRLLYNAFPNVFTPTIIKNLTMYENILKKDLPFKYKKFFFFVKNASYFITKTPEQRERDNTNHALKNQEKREKGFCPCGKPLSSNNRARCIACSQKEARRLKGTYQAAKEKGWCVTCREEKKPDGTCSKCADYYIRRRMRSLNLYKTKVKGLPEDAPIECNRCKTRLDNEYQCVCFTLHHDRYLDEKAPMKRSKNTLTFDSSLEKHGVEWFQEEETRSCHDEV